MDEARCLSDRSLRYGRNIMVICFISGGVKFFAADFSEATLFGIEVQEKQFWQVLFFLLIWHLVYFVVLLNDDIRNWWSTYITDRYPSSKFVTYFRTPPEGITVDRRTYTFPDHPTHFQWQYRKGTHSTTGEVSHSNHNQIRRTILRVVVLDGGFPILFSLFTIFFVMGERLTFFLVVREWLTLTFWAFWKFVVETLFG